MHCNGHCQMKKRLSEEDRQHQENPERRSDNKSEHFVPGIITAEISPVCITVANKYYPPQTIGTPIDLSYTVFHPPGA